MQNLDNNLISLINNFVFDLNENYKFESYLNRNSLINIYSKVFFNDLNQRKILPAVANCLWVLFLLDKLLRENNYICNLNILKMLENDKLLVHFVLKLNLDSKIYYIDFVNNTFILSDRFDILIQEKNKLGVNLVYRNLLNLDYENFEEDILPNIFVKELSDWSFDNLINSLLMIYTDEKFKVNKLNFSFEVRVN